MAYSIQQVHNLIFFFARKQQNAFFSHDDVDMLLDFYQMAVFSKMTGRPEGQPGMMPLPQTGYGQTQYFDDALSPFKKTVNFLYADTPKGLITLPSNYERLTSIYAIVSNNATGQTDHKGIQVLTEDQVPGRLDSQILPPSLSKPFAVFAGVNSSGGYQIQLYPNQPMAGVYTYFMRPPAPKFSYTMNGRQVVFNQAGSTNLLWNDEVQVNLILATLQAVGVNITDQIIEQLSQIKQKEGAVA